MYIWSVVLKNYSDTKPTFSRLSQIMNVRERKPDYIAAFPDAECMALTLSFFRGNCICGYLIGWPGKCAIYSVFTQSSCRLSESDKLGKFI